MWNDSLWQTTNCWIHCYIAVADPGGEGPNRPRPPFFLGRFFFFFADFCYFRARHRGIWIPGPPPPPPFSQILDPPLYCNGWLTHLQSKSVCMDAFSKQRNQKKIWVTFFVLNSKLKSFWVLKVSQYCILLMSKATCMQRTFSWRSGVLANVSD